MSDKTSFSMDRHLEALDRIVLLEEQLRNAISLLHSYGSQMIGCSDAIGGIAFPKTKKKRAGMK